MYRLKQKQGDFIVDEVIELDKSNGKYSYFLVSKKGVTTIKACEEIARFLGKSINDVSYAGMKDRHSKSTQYISVHDTNKKDFSINGIDVKYVGSGNEKISIGSLDCNRFKITVRNLKIPLAKINSMANYYGEQRFGTIRPNTALVGKKIIEGKVEDAMRIYLGKAYKREGKRERTFRKDVDKNFGDWRKIKVPRGLDVEYKVVKYLSEKPRDFAGAFKIMPMKLGRLFVHAYQSYLFNECLRKYIEENFDYLSCGYCIGKMSFPKEDVFVGKEMPIIGYNLKKSDFDRIIKDVLEKENLKIESFKIKKMDSFSGKSLLRNVFVKLKNFWIGNFEDDEINKGMKKQLVKFDLGKGSYATVGVRYCYEVGKY